MAHAQDNAKERLTLSEALRDFGWLPLTLISTGGGLAVIDIAERVVFDGFALIMPFQIVLDGYRRVTDVIGASVEPAIRPAVDWLNAHFNWHVHLQAFWRSLFVLGMVFVMGVVRAAWRIGAWGSSILALGVMGLGALAGSVAVGLVPLGGGWWAQGLVAAAASPLLFFALGIAGANDNVGADNLVAAWRHVVVMIQGTALFGVVAFVLGAGASFVPGLSDGAGSILVLGLFIAGIGIYSFLHGLHDADRDASRIGLSILGGFVAGGLILLSNWVVIALS